MARGSGCDPLAKPTPTRRHRVSALAGRLVRSPRSQDIQSHDRTALEAFNEGVKFGASGDRDAAIAAYKASVATGDSDLTAQALFNVAALCSDDLEAATNAYLAAIETNHPDVAPRAAFNLWWLLAAQGDLAGATTMLRRALEFGHDDVSLRAALKLDSVRAELLITRWTASRSAAESPERLFQAWASVRVATTSE
jgi:tetratricopeptide (TPR) repeat protein